MFTSGEVMSIKKAHKSGQTDDEGNKLPLGSTKCRVGGANRISGNIRYLEATPAFVERRAPVKLFFFKQKTAYEISECDWSSDVCYSDLKQKRTRLNSSHIQKSRMPSSARDRKSTRLNSSHIQKSRMPSSA